MPARTVLERSLVEVIDDLLRLSSMTEKALSNAMKALIERNAELGQTVSSKDTLLNQIRYEIEESCYRILATQQPNSKDLRLIVGAVSVATNLERIGDHAAGIARLALRMVNQPLLKPLVDLPQMAEIGGDMVRDAVTAFTTQDSVLAESVVRADVNMDRLHKQVYDELIGYMTRDNTTIERATFLLWVSHNLERIGDRAVNISERAVYVANGELREFN